MKNFKVFALKIFELIKWYLATRNFEKIHKKTDKNVLFVELCTSLLTIKINCLFSLALKKKIQHLCFISAKVKIL